MMHTYVKQIINQCTTHMISPANNSSCVLTLHYNPCRCRRLYSLSCYAYCQKLYSSDTIKACIGHNGLHNTNKITFFLINGATDHFSRAGCNVSNVALKSNLFSVGLPFFSGRTQEPGLSSNNKAVRLIHT